MDTEVVVFSGVDMRVKSGHSVNPCFDLPMLESVHGWRKMWFFQRNVVAAMLPAFMGNRPISQPN
jgi:hypothetical protein